MALRVGSDTDTASVLERALSEAPVAAASARLPVPADGAAGLLPQQSVALGIAHAAIEEAPGGSFPLGTLALFELASGGGATPFRVRWTPTGWRADATGSADGPSGALVAALAALRGGEIDCAVLGAVDLVRDRPGDSDAAVALVLCRESDVVRSGGTCLAVIDDAPGPAIAFGDGAAWLGHTGAARDLIGVALAALALRDRVLPPFADDGTSRRARAWLHDTQSGPRRARTGAIVLRAGNAPARRRRLSSALFLLHPGELDALSAYRAAGEPIHATAARWWRRGTSLPGERLALVVRDRDDLPARVAAARRVLAGGLRERGVWWTPQPLAPAGDVAFVYPGSGSHYAGMGLELSAWFADVMCARGDGLTRYRTQLATDFAWSADAPHDPDDHGPLLRAQVGLGTLVTDVVRAFGVEPQATLGYSLGESAGLWALDAWTSRDEIHVRLRDSTLFSRDLAGPCDAARAVWNVPPDVPVFWVIGVIEAPADVVREALTRHPRTYLLIVNTDTQCVIGGAARAVRGLIDDIGAVFHDLPGVTTVHCEVAEPVAEAYHALHVFEPVTPREGVRFYSAAWGRAYVPTPESAADSITDCALHGFDFPKLVRQAYDDGARLFVEIGPGASCTRMIREILGDRPHAAAAVCVRTRDALESLFDTLGLLATHGVGVDLGVVYGRRPEAAGGRP